MKTTEEGETTVTWRYKKNPFLHDKTKEEDPHYIENDTKTPSSESLHCEYDEESFL